MTESVCWPTKTSIPPPLGLLANLVVHFLPSPSVFLCVCLSALFRLALGGQPSAFPMMCLGNLFPGQPGYQILSQWLLAGASFVYTFHICGVGM